MNVFKRMAPGAALFGSIGPLIVGLGFGTLCCVIVAFNGHHGLGSIVLKWLGVSGLASMVAYYAGTVPAAFAGLIAGAISFRFRPPWFYVLSIPFSLMTCIFYFTKIYDGGDTAILFGSVFSIPATVILGKCLLRIVRRSEKRAVSQVSLAGGAKIE